MAEACPYHQDHENRMERLEDEMKEVKKALPNTAIWVAVIGAFASMMAGLCSFCGVITVAYLKSRGLMP